MLTKQQHELERQADVVTVSKGKRGRPKGSYSKGLAANKHHVVTTRVNVADLKNGYYIFGNKGNVWSNECHIGKSDFSGRTLCGVPMLSSNWARIEEVDTIGCPECLKRYSA